MIVISQIGSTSQDRVRIARHWRGRHKNAVTIQVPLWLSMYSVHAHNVWMPSIMTLHHNNDKIVRLKNLVRAGVNNFLLHQANGLQLHITITVTWAHPIVMIAALEPSCIHVACCMFTIVLRLRLRFPTNSLGQHFILYDIPSISNRLLVVTCQ